MTTTVLTVGDALIDHFLHVENASRFCEIKQDTHQVCFIPGSKIMVDTSEFCLGGNACNVAVGLARLGNTTALAAEIGDDEFSQKILQGLAADHIQTEFVKQTIGAQTTF